MVSGVFGGMGGCAMIGQTAIISVREAVAGSLVSSWVMILLFVLFLSPLIERIPLAALVGVMFVVSQQSFAWASLRVLNKVPRNEVLTIVAVTVSIGLAMVYPNKHTQAKELIGSADKQLRSLSMWTPVGNSVASLPMSSIRCGCRECGIAGLDPNEVFGQLPALPLSFERPFGQSGVCRKYGIGHPVDGFFLGTHHDLLPVRHELLQVERLPIHSTVVNVSLRIPGSHCALTEKIARVLLER